MRLAMVIRTVDASCSWLANRRPRTTRASWLARRTVGRGSRSPLDVHAETIAVAVAEPGRGGEVRSLERSRIVPRR
jgi:hypothetical protein